MLFTCNVFRRIDFSNNQESIFVPIRSAAVLDSGEQAIAISNCDSAEGLDLKYIRQFYCIKVNISSIL